MKKKNEKEKVPLNEIQVIQKEYINELESNPEFSLIVDPTNKYHLSDDHRSFIENFIQFRSIATAAELSGIDMDRARQYYLSYATQEELRRINRALYQRQFKNKLLNLDEIGGYLSSLITEENVPIADRIGTKDKLKVVDTLIEVIKLKQDGFQDPSELMEKNLEYQLKDLSVKTIQRMLAETDETPLPSDIKNSLSADEKAYLQTLPAKDILDLLNTTNKEDKHE